MDLQPGTLHRTGDLRAAGVTPVELRRLCRAGVLHRMRRGSYLVGPELCAEELRHALLMRSTMRELSDEAVASHISAAVLHGLPVWGVPLHRAQVTRGRRSGARATDRVRVHTAPLRPDEVTLVDGLAVTCLARTVVDVARTVPFEQAVVVADAALASGRVEPAALAEAVARVAGWPGSPSARRVVQFADGLSESVGESRSRVAIERAGLPRPVVQWEVRTQAGRVRRVDFGWPELATVGEFDGRAKYGRLLRPGEDAAEAVYAEKLREDELRDEDLAVVRWGWADLDRFDVVAERLRRRFRPA